MREFKVGDKVKIPSEPDSEWGIDWDISDTCGSIGNVVRIAPDGYVGIDIPEHPVCGLGVYTFHLSYLLTEPYNQSEQPMEIDLEKEQVFTEPLEGYEFRDSDWKNWSEIEGLKAIAKDDEGVIYFFDEALVKWNYCRKIQETPKPKTRLLTHFEILKMDAVFRITGDNVLGTSWASSRNIECYEYCLKSDFQKAQSFKDVVWKPLTTEEI